VALIDDVLPRYDVHEVHSIACRWLRQIAA